MVWNKKQCKVRQLALTNHRKTLHTEDPIDPFPKKPPRDGETGNQPPSPLHRGDFDETMLSPLLEGFEEEETTDTNQSQGITNEDESNNTDN
jgi:hypothetical protein